MRWRDRWAEPGAGARGEGEGGEGEASREIESQIDREREREGERERERGERERHASGKRTYIMKECYYRNKIRKRKNCRTDDIQTCTLNLQCFKRKKGRGKYISGE